MAVSNSHRWGQIIGSVLEGAVHSVLESVASDQGLYLDSQGDRPARKGKKVTWKDKYGNSHDLDYVLERGGTTTTSGLPVAFIEIAWRRYTKHSKNKAQEIEGALVPLRDTYNHLNPALACILAGEFTSGALSQLRSRGFMVLYFPLDEVFSAFQSVGIEAYFDESTSENIFEQYVGTWSKISDKLKDQAVELLLRGQSEQIAEFKSSLKRVLSRRVASVTLTILHGKPITAITIADAIAFIEMYDDDSPSAAGVHSYLVDIRFSNGDHIHATFEEKVNAVTFLKSFP